MKRSFSTSIGLIAILLFTVMPTDGWSGSFYPGVVSEMHRIDALTLTSGEDVGCMAIDSKGGFVYLGTWSVPAKIIKIRLSDFKWIDTLTLDSSKSPLSGAIIDPARGFAYFCTWTSPGKLVKIRLSDFTEIEYLPFESGENAPTAAVMDPSGDFAYFGTYTTPGRIIKIQLSDRLNRVNGITLNAEEGDLSSAAIDPTSGFAYFSDNIPPCHVIKIRLSDLNREGALPLASEERAINIRSIDLAAGYIYISTNTSPSMVVKVRLSDFTRIRSLTLSGDSVYSNLIDPVSGYAYFGSYTIPGKVTRVNLVDFQEGGSLTLSDEANINNGIIDTSGGFAYFSTATNLPNPPKLVRIALQSPQQTEKIVSTSHPSWNNWYNAESIKVSWSALDFPGNTAGWFWLMDNNGGTPVTQDNGTALSFANQSIETPINADGMHVFHLIPRDASGTAIPLKQVNFYFYANIISPVITSPSHPDPEQAYDNDTVVLGWTWPDRPGPIISNYKYLYSVSCNPLPSFDSKTITSADQMSITLSGLADGTHYFHLTSIDSLGTTSTATATFAFNIGRRVNLDSCLDTDFATDHNIDFGTSITEANSAYEAKIDAWYYQNWPADRRPIVQNMSMQSGVTKKLTWDIADVPNGTYNIAVTYLDGSGTTHTSKSNGRISVWQKPLELNSPTHPQPMRWYESPNVTINWHRPSDCAPDAISGFRYVLDKNPDTIPSMNDNSTDTLSAIYTINLADYGTNFFHIRWVDRDNNLSRETAHLMFNAVGFHRNDMTELPWYDDISPSFDSNLWYISDMASVTSSNSILRFTNRGYLKSISALFDDPRNNGPYQIELNQVRIDPNAFLVIATRSDNNRRYTDTDLSKFGEAERITNSRIVNRGVEVCLTQTKAEIWMRNVVSGNPSDQFLGSCEGVDLFAGTKDISILDTGYTIGLYVNDNPIPLIERPVTEIMGGGFFFMGGTHIDGSSAASFAAVHIFRPERPHLSNVSIKHEPGLQNSPVFAWSFPLTDVQGMYQVQVQTADRTWQQLPLWDSGEQLGMIYQCQYGAGGGSPASAPPLVEGKLYKFRVRAKNRTLWSPWSGQNEQGDEFSLNQLPLVTNVTIAPAAPTDDDPLTATASGSDPESDPVSFSYRWFCDQVYVSDLTGATVPADRTTAGQAWQVEVTPFDGFNHGQPQSSPEVTIGPTTAKNNVHAIWTIYH